MDYCFRFALAVGFLALPLSLFAEEQGSPGGGDHRPKGQDQTMRQKLEAKVKELKKQHPQLTQEQKEKIKAAMQKEEQKRKETQSKLANWKENHPSDTPPGKLHGEQDKRQSTGNGSKGQGERFQGGGHPGGARGGGHGDGGHAGGHK